jgi:hypothetical protein
MRLSLCIAACVAVATAICLVSSASGASAGQFPLTPLDEYVNRPDSAYSWTDTGVTVNGDFWTGYILNMTSQAWLSPEDWHFGTTGARTGKWWHYLLVVVPHELNASRSDTSFVYITGTGNKPDDLPTNPTDEEPLIVSLIAAQAGVVGGILYQVPNEPLVFDAEVPPKSRQEDALIAWCWRHFQDNTSDTEWLPRLPMTKAAFRAMDTIAAFRAQQTSGQANIDKFIVAGASSTMALRTPSCLFALCRVCVLTVPPCHVCRAWLDDVDDGGRGRGSAQPARDRRHPDGHGRTQLSTQHPPPLPCLYVYPTPRTAAARNVTARAPDMHPPRSCAARLCRWRVVVRARRLLQVSRTRSLCPDPLFQALTVYRLPPVPLFPAVPCCCSA